MARHKSFGSPVLNSDEPLTFDLYDTTYRCKPAMQGRLLIEFIARSSADDPAAGAQAVLDFFDSAIVESDLDHFKAVLSSDDKIVPMDTLTEIMDWMIEEYTGRPTQPPSDSESGPPTTGPTSEEEHSFTGVPVSTVSP